MAEFLGGLGNPERGSRDRRERWYCEACEAPFWVLRGVETVHGGPYFCPYCGSDKDTVRQ
jgi:rubrerythrin